MNMFEDLAEFVNGVEMQMFKMCSAATQQLVWSYVLQKLDTESLFSQFPGHESWLMC